MPAAGLLADRAGHGGPAGLCRLPQRRAVAGTAYARGHHAGRVSAHGGQQPDQRHCPGQPGLRPLGLSLSGRGHFFLAQPGAGDSRAPAHHGELPKPVRPTIGIQLAPPLVACTAYLSVNGGVADIFAQVLFGYGLLQLIFLARLLVWTFEQPFSPPSGASPSAFPPCPRPRCVFWRTIRPVPFRC